MRSLSLIILVLSAACAHSPPEASGGKPHILVFDKEFAAFWKRAEKATLSAQTQAWNELVEGPHQEFYDSFVWPAKSAPDFSQRRTKRLEKAFASYRINSTAISKTFQNFESTLNYQLARFQSAFTDAYWNDKLIIGALAPTFNGHSGHLPSQPKTIVLAFGLDMIVERGDNADTLFSHELFHIYHAQQSAIRDDGDMPEAPVTIPLWAEGLATYASYELNPSAAKQDIFMDASLAGLSDSELPAMAQGFLKIADHLVEDSHHPNTYRKWFMFNQNWNPRYPSRCGYWLGFKVIQALRAKYSLAEMANLKMQDAHHLVIDTLRNLATGATPFSR